MRASLYNAMPVAGVQALVDFMADFQDSVMAERRSEAQAAAPKADGENGKARGRQSATRGRAQRPPPKAAAAPTSARRARADRRHRPRDPGADRRARAVGAPGRQGQGQARRGGRLLPPRARGAGAAARGGPQRWPARDEVLVRAVPRDHVGLPGAAGAAEDRLPRPGRHVHAAGGAQALRPFRARACRWPASRKCSRKSQPATPISAWCRSRTRGRARSSRRWTCS